MARVGNAPSVRASVTASARVGVLPRRTAARGVRRAAAARGRARARNARCADVRSAVAVRFCAAARTADRDAKARAARRTVARVQHVSDGARPLLLDLFCGAGGAAMGYHRAGFDVIGVDVKPQPRYPFPFVQADALDFLRLLSWLELQQYAAIHAAPLWHRFAPLQLGARAVHEDHVTPALRALEETGLPFVLESGTLGPLPRSELVMLCGASAGLEVVRHMYFKTNWPCMVPPCSHRPGGTTDGTYVAFRSSGKVRIGRKTPPRRAAREWRACAGLDWMSLDEARLASPPAYTELIGAQLLAVLERSRTLHVA